MFFYCIFRCKLILVNIVDDRVKVKKIIVCAVFNYIITTSGIIRIVKVVFSYVFFKESDIPILLKHQKTSKADKKDH